MLKKIFKKQNKAITAAEKLKRSEKKHLDHNKKLLQKIHNEIMEEQYNF